MKKLLLSFMSGLALSACGGGSSSSSAPQPLININSVTIGKLSGDTQASEFSTLINFTNGHNSLNNWQLGFYMPRSYDSLVTTYQNINPNLIMQICSVNRTGLCANLNYQLAPQVTNNDLSAGYTSMLTPATQFILESGSSYTISLLHSNQWEPGNYSAVPQNFFIIANGQTINLTTTSNLYNLVDYNTNAVNNTVTEHINTIWTNSNTNDTNANLIPAPVSYTAGSGQYVFQNGIQIHNELNTDNSVANFFKSNLQSDLGLSSSVDNQSGASSGIIINLISDPSQINNNPEGYLINISTTAITISALNNTGAFYALQTLRQLWNQNTSIAVAQINDYPRFKYRGVLLDSARHFFSVAEVKELIDLAAIHKLNTLHFHFADDEGFRIGLTSYPSLSSVGDLRGYGNNMTGLMFIQGNLDTTNYTNALYPFVNTNYSGTYSQADLLALIQYANARSITIIPEIDLPGHARALIKALPSDFVDPNDLSQFISVQGYNDDVIPVCTYNTSTSVGPQFTPTINSILTQTASLFNNQATIYAVNSEVSIGGDEVSSGAWTKDSSCSGSWANLSALAKSQKFFQLLASSNANLKISGWQQFVQNDDETLGQNIVPASQTAHVWVWNTSGAMGQAQVATLANSQYPVVIDYADENYFDIAYTPQISEPGFTWSAPFVDTQAALASAASATTTINQISVPNQANVLGLEGTLWSENLANYNHLVYMGFPKMAGLAEAAWSPSSLTNQSGQVDWKSLAHRLGCGQSGFLNYLDKLYGIHYRGYPNGISLEVPSAACDVI